MYIRLKKRIELNDQLIFIIKFIYIYNSRLLNKTVTLSFIKYEVRCLSEKKNEITYEHNKRKMQLR